MHDTITGPRTVGLCTAIGQVPAQVKIHALAQVTAYTELSMPLPTRLPLGRTKFRKVNPVGDVRCDGSRLSLDSRGDARCADPLRLDRHPLTKIYSYA